MSNACAGENRIYVCFQWVVTPTTKTTICMRISADASTHLPMVDLPAKTLSYQGGSDVDFGSGPSRKILTKRPPLLLPPG